MQMQLEYPLWVCPDFHADQLPLLMTKDGIVDVYEQGWHGSIHGLRSDVEVIGFKDEWMFAK